MSRAARLILTVTVWLGLSGVLFHQAAAQETPQNLFGNPGFEEGPAGWGGPTAPGTVASFKVTDEEAAEGERSALVTLGNAAGFGYQFGQTLPGGQTGKTYTFAVLAKAVGGRAVMQLEVERRGDPWDRAGRSRLVALGEDKWTELHTTFTTTDDFLEGWFAYVSCSQPNVQFRVDMFRLYEGEYVAYELGAAQQARAPRPQAPAAGGAEPRNLLKNSGFEAGAEGWVSFVPAGTTARASITENQAAEGRHSALISLEEVTGPGLRFGQRLPGGRRGRTYTFAVLAKGLSGAVPVHLEVERSGEPWESAGKGQPAALQADEWTELHLTFTATDDYPEGWFACVSCARPYAHFVVDAFRLYEGEYVARGPGAPQQAQPAAPAPAVAQRPQAQTPSPQPSAAGAAEPQNLFKNAGFEQGTAGWGGSKAVETVASFKVTDDEAAEGQHSALVTVKDAVGYGYQFGQRVQGGQKGKTYSFAVLAKAVGGPALVQLEVERAGGDYDRAGRSGPTILRTDRWTDLHTTFTTTDDFLEGWFAYVSCSQPNVEFRVDAFRLYEGEYVPHEALAADEGGPGGQVEEQENLFGNPGFEMGTAGWSASHPADSEVDFKVTEDDAAQGSKSALLTLGTVAGWGCQFGQTLPGGQKGKTYTFAALGKAVGGPVTVQLEVERAGRPWDRAGRTGSVALKTGEWTELHTTFTVEDDFPEGWFAYASCSQPNAKFRVDAVRLYAGDYVPHGQQQKKAATAAPIEEVPDQPEPAEPVLDVLPPMVRLFDTRQPVGGPLAPDAPAHLDRWTQVAEGDVGHQFAGDAVLLNNRLAVALRKGAAGAEVYSVGRNGLKLRAVLAPATPGTAAELSSLKLSANGPDSVVADLDFRTADGAALSLACELNAGQMFVKTGPGEGVEALRVEAPCRFGVLPDFFADDIVVDATGVAADRVELPSENFFLHMLPDRNAMVMAVWTSREEDMHVDLAGTGAQRTVRASEVPYGKDGNVYVAVLEGRRLWHVHQVASADAGRVSRLKWKAPFTAHWRVDWTRDDKLTDSWEMAVGRPGGGYSKPSFGGYEGRLPASRERWTTVIGTFEYPCWIESDGQACLQPLGSVLRFVGPALIYPINRVRETPLDVYTVTDVVRETLGVGPCEYILDLEGQRTTRQGLATCPTRDRLDAIYAKGEQKQRRAQVERTLTDVIIFIKHIRSRIEHYVTLGHDVLAYLEEQEQGHPELAKPIAGLKESAMAIDNHVAARSHLIKTPEYAEALADQFRETLLDDEGTDALERCKGYTAAWVEIGGNQDHLVGECRLAVKVLRQRAGLVMAEDPRMAEISREVRRRCQEALKNPTSYEAPRH